MFTFRYERSTAGEEIIVVLEAGPADELVYDTAGEAEAAAMYALDIERAVAKGPLARWAPYEKASLRRNRNTAGALRLTSVDGPPPKGYCTGGRWE
jgi:hypothetical protein